MGRYNFTALRVRQKALRTLDAYRPAKKPNWLDVVGDIPPAQALIRTPPIQHELVRERLKTIPATDGEPARVRAELEVATKRPTRSKKASKIFKPIQMRYEEDELRKRFYRDHPWELARPRIVLENDGKDFENYDWSKLQQIGKKLDGERYHIPRLCEACANGPTAWYRDNCIYFEPPPTSRSRTRTTLRGKSFISSDYMKISSDESRVKKLNT